MMGKVGMNSKLLLFVIAGLIVSSYYANDIFAEEKNSVGQIQWLEANYPSDGVGHVRIIDPDMNLDPESIDNFYVDVWSDSDFTGIDLAMTETNYDTGTFEGTVFFTTTDESSGHRLRVMAGDTIYSKYEDNTLPDSHTKNKLDEIGTASIEGTSDSIIDDRISLDKNSYTWADKIYVTIIAPEYNLDSDSIEKIDASERYSVKIVTRHFEIDDYQLIETGIDTGVFAGEITLSGNEFYDVNSNWDDGISVIFEYAEDKVAIGSAPIDATQSGDPIIYSSPLKQQNEMTPKVLPSDERPDAYLEWLDESYPSSGTGVVRVVDHFMNQDSEESENLTVYVYTEETEDEGGLTVTVTETNYDTGIFEGTIFFSETQESGGHRLHVADGEIIGAEYMYSTVPGSDKIENMIGVGQEIVIKNPPDVEQHVTLKQQLADNVSLEKILCSNSLHVLTERTNGNLACVYSSTAEKLGWKLIN